MKVVSAIMIVLGGVILFALFFPTVSVGPSDAPKAHAKNDVEQLKVALQAYLSEYGVPPRGDNPRLMQILKGDNPKKIVFLKPPENQINEAGAFVDPWGTPYLFGYSLDRSPWTYSIGKNRIDEGGEGDDVNAWR